MDEKRLPIKLRDILLVTIFARQSTGVRSTFEVYDPILYVKTVNHMMLRVDHQAFAITKVFVNTDDFAFPRGYFGATNNCIVF